MSRVRCPLLFWILTLLAPGAPLTGPFLESGTPFFHSALLMGQKDSGNKVRRGVVVPVGEGRWACFDTDLLRWAAFWEAPEGQPPLTLDSMAAISYPQGKAKAHSPPRLQGRLLFANPVRPGEGREAAERASLVHPAKGGGVGPLRPERGRWLGVALRGEVPVLRYRVRDAVVEECLSSGVEGQFQRVMEIAPHREPLAFRVHPRFQSHLGAGTLRDGFLEVPPSDETVTVLLATGVADPLSLPEESAADPPFPESVVVRNEGAREQGPYRIRSLTLPETSRFIRPTDLAFLPDGTGLLATLDGDVWRIETPQAATSRWTRIASGLFETLSIETTADGRVFTLGRNQITELIDHNGDGQIDLYRNASNAFQQTLHTRDYATSLALDDDGSFLLAKGGIHSKGGKDNELSAHRGAVLRISPDGDSVRVLADGLRLPYVGLRRDGAVFASDQQGHHVPSTPVHLIGDDQPFLGFAPTNFRDREPVAPLLWFPYQVNRSAAAFAQWHDLFLQVSWGGRLFAIETPERGLPFSWQLPLQLDFPSLKAARAPKSGHLYVAGLGISGYKPTTPRLLGLASIEEVDPFPRPVALEVADKRVIVTFDRALRDDETLLPASPALRMFDVKRSPNYGSGHFRWDGKPGEVRLQPIDFGLSGDRRTLTLSFELLVPSKVWALGLTLSSGPRLFPLTLFARPDQLAAPDPKSWQALFAKEAEVKPGEPARGKPLFAQFACSGCHSLDGTKLVGPSLQGIATRLGAADLRQSLLDPNAVVAEGFPAAMPSFEGVLTDQQLADLVAYLQTLREE